MQGRRENVLSPKLLYNRYIIKLPEFFYISVLSLINVYFMNEQHLIKAKSVEEWSILPIGTS